MTLLQAKEISKSFGSKNLFEGLSFTINPKERIGLIGPNGAGKSTLLHLLRGDEEPTSGEIVRERGLKIAFASQHPHFPPKQILDLLADEESPGSYEERRLRAEILLTKAEFPSLDLSAHTLSGGWKKRLDIARALMQEPDILLLDEPTNHLDLEGIEWLERLIQRESAALLIVSHDRSFLERIATRIIEINPCFEGGLFTQPGNLSSYLEKRDAFIESERERKAALKSSLRTELDWLSRGPKARTTKAEARIKQAEKLKEEYADLTSRLKTKQAAISFSASERETRKLISAKNLSKALGGRSLFKQLDLTLSPGTRIGIVGKNGTGKTTLMRILSGEIQADTGTIKYADEIKISYFDQHRETLSPTETVREALSGGRDYVTFQGREIHVNGWARRFLFSEERLTLPVRMLSGGERARLVMARFMLRPADVLMLDEPTNDLDIPTLEVLEESLSQFIGAVLFVSHDRSLMENLATGILALEEGSHELFASYRQWEMQKREKVQERVQKKEPEGKKVKGLSYKEKRELEGMEEAIINQEALISSLEKELYSGKETKETTKLYEELGKAQLTLDTLYERWQQLEISHKGASD